MIPHAYESVAGFCALQHLDVFNLLPHGGLDKLLPVIVKFRMLPDDPIHLSDHGAGKSDLNPHIFRLNDQTADRPWQTSNIPKPSL